MSMRRHEARTPHWQRHPQCARRTFAPRTPQKHHTPAPLLSAAQLLHIPIRTQDALSRIHIALVVVCSWLPKRLPNDPPLTAIVPAHAGA
ncbi:hypothetical protein B0H16DRAFT_1722165 [Mycena metata]|uniref:Uncharacterized protein n=1 Tax=Mycena metata TaxID=1033252 RepID=A0AAD7J2H3_9AGAR|nr:hypothetical protein B0H16DRAFT_1722165 [Mycena metata]